MGYFIFDTSNIKTYAFLFFTIFFSTCVKAQFEELTVVGKQLLPSFELEGKSISKKEVRDFLKRTCPEAVPTFNKSRNKEIIAFGLASASLGILCMEFIEARDSERKQPSLGTVSALSFATASIFFELSSRKGYLRTVKIYNDHKGKPSPIDLNLGITPSGGLGLNMRF
jgi:hypothetical protein